MDHDPEAKDVNLDAEVRKDWKKPSHFSGTPPDDARIADSEDGDENLDIKSQVEALMKWYGQDC